MRALPRTATHTGATRSHGPQQPAFLPKGFSPPSDWRCHSSPPPRTSLLAQERHCSASRSSRPTCQKVAGGQASACPAAHLCRGAAAARHSRLGEVRLHDNLQKGAQQRGLKACQAGAEHYTLTA